MRPEELLQIMGQAAKLKQATRHCWIEADRKESVVADGVNGYACVS